MTDQVVETTQEALLESFLQADSIADSEASEYENPLEAHEAQGEPAAEAGDEAESIDDTGEDDAGDGEEAGAEAEAAGDAEDYVEIAGEDGEIERVPLSELLEARTQLQGLGSTEAEIRQRIVESVSQQTQERITQLDTYIRDAAQTFTLLEQLVPNVAEPDMSLLDQNSPNFNPALYREQTEIREQVQQLMTEARGGLEQQIQHRERLMQAERQRDMEKEWVALTAADPTWREGDSTKRLTDLRNGVASAYGISKEVIGSVYNAGFIRMAEDALAFRKAQGTVVPKGAKPAARLVRGGKGKSAVSPDKKRAAKAEAHLRKTGEVVDLEATWGKYL